MQDCSRDERTHPCGTALQALQGESHGGLRGTEEGVRATQRGPTAVLMDQVMVVLCGENMFYRTPFIPNFGLAMWSVVAGNRPVELGTWYGREGVSQGFTSVPAEYCE